MRQLGVVRIARSALMVRAPHSIPRNMPRRYGQVATKSWNRSCKYLGIEVDDELEMSEQIDVKRSAQ